MLRKPTQTRRRELRRRQHQKRRLRAACWRPPSSAWPSCRISWLTHAQTWRPHRTQPCAQPQLRRRLRPMLPNTLLASMEDSTMRDSGVASTTISSLFFFLPHFFLTSLPPPPLKYFFSYFSHPSLLVTSLF